MIVRKYEASDCEQLASLFYSTVHSVNARDYTKEQLDVWATGTIDLTEWNKSFLLHFTVVAVENDIIVGFGDIDSTGYLDRLFVHKNYQNQGVATAVCNELEQASHADTIITHASVTAKAFFENRGYKILKCQEVERRGVLLENYVMEKSLVSAPV